MANFTPIGVEAVVQGLNKFNTDLASMDKKIQNLGNSVQISSSKFSGFGKAIGGAAAIAGGALVTGIGAATAGIVGIGLSSTKTAMTMEQNLADIAAVMGKTSDEIEPLSKLIQNLGIDPNLKVSASQAAESIELLARNGITLDQILNGAAKSSILLANATGSDFGLAADIATDSMSIFNIKAEEMSSAVDGITSVVNNSKFGINDYALALAQGSGVAATVGVSFNDFNTTVAAIAPLFSSGSDAGTSFKTFLQRLIPASKEAENEMMKLGLMTADGSNQFFDASGNMKSMAEITGLLSDATSQLSDEQLNNSLSTIFGADALRAAAGLAALNTEEFSILQETMADTSAADSVATRMNTLSGTMEILGGIIETLKINIGNSFLPMWQELAEALTKVVTDNKDIIVKFFENIANVLSDILPKAIDILIGWMDNLNTTISKLQSFFELLGKAIGGNEDAYYQLRGEYGAFGDAAIKVYNFVQNLLLIFSDIQSSISTNLSPVISNLSDIFNNMLGSAIGFVIDKFNNFFLPAINSVWDFITNSLIPKLSEFAGAIGGSEILTAIGDISKKIDDFRLKILQLLLDKFDDILNWLVDNKTAIKTAVDAVVTVISTAFKTLTKEDGVIDKLLNSLDKIIDWFSSGESEAKTAVDGFVKTIEDALNDITKDGGLVDSINKAFDTILKWWNDNDEEIITAIDGVIASIIELFDKIVDDATPLLTDAFDKISKWWDDNGENVKKAIENIGTAFETAASAIGIVWDGLEPLLRTVGDVIGDVVAIIVALLANDFETAFKNAGKIVTDVVGDTESGIIGSVFGISGGISEAFGGPDTQEGFDIWGTNWENAKLATSLAMGAVTSSITEQIKKAKDAMDDVMDGISQAIKDGLGDVKSYGSEIVAALSNGISSSLATLSSLVAQFKMVGNTIILGIKAGLVEKSNEIIDYLVDLGRRSLDKIKEIFGIGGSEDEETSVSSFITKRILNTVDLLFDEITSLSSSINNTLSGLFDSYFKITSTRASSFLETELSSLANDFQKNVILDQLEQFSQLGFMSYEDLGFTVAEKGIGSLVDIFESLNAEQQENLSLLGDSLKLLKEQEDIQIKLSEIEEKRNQIKFLEEQMNLIKLINENGLDAAILDGIEFGINANIQDILDAMAEAMGELLIAAEDKLGIKSPSKKFAEIGMNIMRGLGQGIVNAVSIPKAGIESALNIMTPETLQAPMVTNNSNVTFNNSISNPMDLATVEAVINRSLAGAF